MNSRDKKLESRKRFSENDGRELGDDDDKPESLFEKSRKIDV